MDFIFGILLPNQSKEWEHNLDKILRAESSWNGIKSVVAQNLCPYKFSSILLITKVLCADPSHLKTQTFGLSPTIKYLRSRCQLPMVSWIVARVSEWCETHTLFRMCSQQSCLHLHFCSKLTNYLTHCVDRLKHFVVSQKHTAPKST